MHIPQCSSSTKKHNREEEERRNCTVLTALANVNSTGTCSRLGTRCSLHHIRGFTPKNRNSTAVCTLCSSPTIPVQHFPLVDYNILLTPPVDCFSIRFVVAQSQQTITPRKLAAFMPWKVYRIYLPPGRLGVPGRPP